MAKSRLVTLLTDFGTRDPYVAAMKGAILRVCPAAQIVDISHDVPAQDVLAGAFVLAQATPFFPPETLHVVVVDPGVGTSRSILAARLDGQLFLFPDNGIITFVAQALPMEAIVAVRNIKALRPGPESMTFHGRDIFAPVAGRILNGMSIADLGPQPGTYKLLDLPAPVEQVDWIIGQVIYVDHFGNLISNIPQELIVGRREDMQQAVVMCGRRDVGTLRQTYDDVAEGEAAALFNSMKLLEIAVNCGRACDVFGADVGTEICLEKR